ncbi:MAG TPA: hypothetical protein VMD97_04615 [Candidatus Aquilonibacter sp.]|nr:hypothetical protein [Candidatus Aquilonibacter sp.]
MILLHAIIAVIHAILQAAASALIAGFSLLIVVLVALAVVGALIMTLAGGLGFGGVHWLRRRWRSKRSSGGGDQPPCS